MPAPSVLQCASETHLWELVPAAIGAVLGAAVSAIPTFLLAKASSNKTDARDNEHRLQNARLAATKGMIRLQRITNSLYTMHHQIEETLVEAHKRGLGDAPVWMQLRPIGGFVPEPIRFEIDELAVVFAAGQSRLSNDLMLMSERHYSDEWAMTQYAEKRAILGDLMDPDIQGTIGSTMQTPENERRFGPRMVELEDMANQMRGMVKSDMEQALALMASYSTAMQKYFDDPKFLVFQLVQTDQPA